MTAGWTLRAAGVHYLLRAQAFRHQNDWARLEGAWRRADRRPTDSGAEALILQLRDSAVELRIPNPRVGEPPWVELLWED